MSNSSIKSGISGLPRPLLMTALMVGMALIGAGVAWSLKAGNFSSIEENHANDSDDSQPTAKNLSEKTASGVASKSLTASNSGVDQHSDHQLADDQLSRPTSPTSQDTGDTNHMAAVPAPSLPTESPITDSASADPFSEAALGFVDSDAASARKSLIANTDVNHADLAVQSKEGDVPAPTAALTNSTNSSVKSKLRDDKSAQQAVNLMTIADEQLASGSYVQAMHAYQAIRQKSQGSPSAAILIRLALCAEAAGRRAAALEAYRKVAAMPGDPAWAGVARYGEARCLAAVQRHDGLQSDLLRRVLLDESEFLPTVRNELLHLIGRDLWREQSSMTTLDLLDDKTFIVPDWTADPARLLNELPMLIHETPTKIGPIEFQVLHVSENTPAGISVRLHCGTTRIQPLLNDLVVGCRLKCEISAQATSNLGGRTQQIHVTDSTLAAMLDGLTIPYDLCWKVNNETVSILHRDEVTPLELRQSRLSSAERILRIAVTEGSISRQAGHSRLALATLLYEQDKIADAVQFLQVQIETEPRSVVETEAAFNLGKCQMALNQRHEARESFLRSIDAAGGHSDVKIAAYIFTSRLLLEDNHSKLSISNMMRGVALSEDSAMEPFASLQLGSAYLIFDNPQGANSVLMEKREKLASGPGREAAAFVSALARFRAAVLADRREREGWAVVSALSEFKPEKYCGGHWAVLVAEACDELGLTGQATEAYLLALRKLPPSWLRDRTILRMAARYQNDHEFDEAGLLLATLTTTEANQLAQQAKLRSAELSLQQDRPDEAILACRALIDSTDEPQVERAALRIMGKAYERQKNHQAAIYCFAGMLPEPGTSEKSANSAVVPSGQVRPQQ